MNMGGKTLCGAWRTTHESQPHLGCQLQATSAGKWLWVHELGHLSAEDRAVVMQLGKVEPMNDLSHVGRVLNKYSFRDLGAPCTRTVTHT